ncbi:PREDICTED: polymeric immunoglobulin receptor-like, partial [Poecilia mexicana]|uniref:polymeric immunoglobulin receptor-like n=1 Tax=Poecilia mexicana TaxID=48701 RepID=UPI00072E52B3
MSCVTSDVIPVFGYVSSAARVSCPYPAGYEDYEKYLCKNDCNDDDDVLVKSKGNSNKYSIYDDQKALTFTVTISHLRFDDAGKYWCGVTRTGNDIYTEVKLEVANDRWVGTPTKIQGNEEGLVSINCSYKTDDDVNNLKYVCTGNRRSVCLQQAIITSNKRQNGRFKLTDDKNARVFTVTISRLSLRDSGSYLFGVQRNAGWDGFCAFELEVKDWCCVTSKYMKGIEGRQITWQCPYPREHRNNRMFICKGNQRSDCTDMMGQTRFAVHSVSSSSFSVSITNLEARDAGTYWCRSNSEWSVGSYIQVHLSVVYQRQTTTVTAKVTTASPQTTTSIPDESDQGGALYGLFVGPPVLLMIVIIIILVVCKKKCHKVK